MVLNKLVASIGVGFVLMSASAANAVTMYTDVDMWKVDVTTFQGTAVVGGAEFSTPSSLVLSGGSTLSNFSPAVTKLVVGSGWNNWVGTPGSNGTSVFYNGNNPSVTMDFNPGVVLQAGVAVPVDAFGLFMESNNYATWSMTMQLSTGGTVTQNVTTPTGAAFFGWTGTGVTQITLSTSNTAGGLAFGQFYEGHTAPVPEPETYALMLAGLAAVGFVARRRKASNA